MLEYMTEDDHIPTTVGESALLKRGEPQVDIDLIRLRTRLLEQRGRRLTSGVFVAHVPSRQLRQNCSSPAADLQQ